MTALRTAQLWKSILSHRCFVQASVPSWVASALGPQFEAFYLRTSKQAYWKPCGVRARNPYVRNKRIRRADTSAFAPSDFYTSMCVYPYAFMHVCNKHTKHGSQYVTWRKFLLRLSSVCTENRYPMQLKKSDSHAQRTHIRAYGSVPYTFFYFCVIYAFGVKCQVLK